MKQGFRLIILTTILFSLAFGAFALESTLTFKGGASGAETDIYTKKQVNGMVGISYEIWLAKFLSIGVHPYITRVQAGPEMMETPMKDIRPVNFQSNLVGGDLLFRLRPFAFRFEDAAINGIAPYITAGGGLVNFYPKYREGEVIVAYDNDMNEKEFDYTAGVAPAVGVGLNFMTKYDIDFELGFQKNFMMSDYLDACERGDFNDSYWMAFLGVSHTFGKGKKVEPIVPKFTLGVSPSAQNVTSPAGWTNFNVISNTMWTVSENVDWLTVSPTSGVNDGSFVVNYDANPSSESRMGEITIIGENLVQTVKVMQSGIMFKVTPAMQNVANTAGTTEFNVAASGAWTVEENEDWLTVEPMNGTGNGTLMVNLDENTAREPRTGMINIMSGGITQMVKVMQAANPLPPLELKSVNFNFDKSTLTETAKMILDANAKGLGYYPEVKIEIQGHTDSVGPKTYNQRLSVKRAQSVKDYLAGKGIAEERMMVKGFGETQPIAPNDTKDGRAQNRRVELMVIE